ncbi:MAG: UvrD-helicase domain-containing protein [Clostridia bacterium]|nr:UvrD-helicase domain-containing protein [Clostridia bacterium]
MNDLFDKLNEGQLSAVTATEGYVRIIAGAGSGKTKTLTHRYGYLVKAAGIHPGNVLCVTFTNKAAGEMKKRVRALIGDGYDNSLITTYHGFCVRVLREDIHRLFYPKSFTILDESDQRKILSEIYTELEIKLDRATFEKILDAVHRLKSNESYVSAMISGDFSAVKVPPVSPVQPVTVLEEEIIRRYLAKQKKIFALDFDDLVSFTFAVFSAFPEVQEKWSERLYYIQVDEFQDSSKRELRLIRSLAAQHGNLFVVGDPDQNIYAWRGADMSILVDFDKTFPGTQTIFLNRNYRSTPKILTAANTLIAHNKNRIPKDLYTVGDAGADIIHLHAKNETEEGKWITEEIRRLVTVEKTEFRQIAILYRASFLSRFIEQALMAANIPYELYGSVRFYERMEIRDTLAYLKLLARDDDDAFERIINTPRRSFGKAKLAALRAMAEEEHISLYEALRRHADDSVFSRSGAAQFVSLMEELRAMSQTKPASELLQEVLTRSGYETYIRENGSMERLENLTEMKRSVWEKEQDWGEFFSLDDYLRQAALEQDRGTDEDADRVKLMTIHASKGLEFPVCFVCGFSEGIFPSSRTLEERKDEGLEEERRLCFVAITRAMRRLYLTESEGTTSDHASKRPSRFLYDIGEQNYTRIGVIPKELADAALPGQNAASPAASRKIGDVVHHPVFGRGIITEIDTAKSVYYIVFDKNGVRRPVSMDYDFDAWQNLGQMKQAAEERLKEELPPPSLPEPISEEAPEIAEEGMEETVADLSAAPAPDFSPENNETAQETLPLPPSDNTLLTAESTTVTEEKAVNEEKPVKKEKSAPPETIPMLPEAESADAETDLPADQPKEMPKRYRNAQWAQAADGEENLWKRDDVPHEGWVCTGIVDLGEPVGVCRMCGHQIIRYVHIMKHPDYYRTIGAGCVCAGRMEGDPEGAKERENAFKNRLARREKFIRSPLKRSSRGNEYVKYKNEIITVLEDKFKRGHYKSVLRGKYSMPYPTKAEALADAFDQIDPWELGED